MIKAEEGHFGELKLYLISEAKSRALGETWAEETRGVCCSSKEEGQSGGGEGERGHHSGC